MPIVRIERAERIRIVLAAEVVDGARELRTEHEAVADYDELGRFVGLELFAVPLEVGSALNGREFAIRGASWRIAYDAGTEMLGISCGRRSRRSETGVAWVAHAAGGHVSLIEFSGPWAAMEH